MTRYLTHLPEVAVGHDDSGAVTLTVHGTTVHLGIDEAIAIAGLVSMSAVEAATDIGGDRDATVDAVTATLTDAFSTYPAADHFAALTRSWTVLGLDQARAAAEYATVALDGNDGDHTFVGDVTLADLAVALGDPEDSTRDFLVKRREVHCQVTALVTST